MALRLLSDVQTGARSERVSVREIFGWNSSPRGDWIRKLRGLYNRGGKLGSVMRRSGRIRSRASIVSPTKCTWGHRPCLSPRWNFSLTTRWNREILPDVLPGGITHLADERVLVQQYFPEEDWALCPNASGVAERRTTLSAASVTARSYASSCTKNYLSSIPVLFVATWDLVMRQGSELLASRDINGGMADENERSSWDIVSVFPSPWCVL